MKKYHRSYSTCAHVVQKKTHDFIALRVFSNIDAASLPQNVYYRVIAVREGGGARTGDASRLFGHATTPPRTWAPGAGSASTFKGPSRDSRDSSSSLVAAGGRVFCFCWRLLDLRLRTTGTGACCASTFPFPWATVAAGVRADAARLCSSWLAADMALTSELDIAMDRSSIRAVWVDESRMRRM